MRRAHGFSLIELMIGTALAALVVAGAMQLHLSFNRQAHRQQQLAELQQTLRVATQLIERAIRSAGAGLPSSHVLPTASARHAGFQYANDNPDWFRVVAADDDATYAGSDGTDVRFWSARAQRWQPRDLLLVVPDLVQPPSACALACARPYTVAHAAPGHITVAAAGDDCLRCAPPGARLRHFSGATDYRVIGSQLMMRTTPFDTPLDDRAYQWTALADGIEDLQIAVILADGKICEDDPATCDFANAAAVRVTLVGGSPELRRTVTTTIQLRSYAP